MSALIYAQGKVQLESAIAVGTVERNDIEPTYCAFFFVAPNGFAASLDLLAILGFDRIVDNQHALFIDSMERFDLFDKSQSA